MIHEGLAEHSGGGGALWPAIGLPHDEAACHVTNDSGTTLFREAGFRSVTAQGFRAFCLVRLKPAYGS